ncbi:MAG: carbon storage regulator [Pirellulaceae bacterium]|nr:carbon storage regulator [Pirellulaceae bacterium]
MLVLSRKSNESIVIGDQIVIEILEISNNKIRIGIAAPTNIRVVRGELTPKAPLQGRVDSVTGRSDGQLPRLRRAGAGGSGNPNVRTVADAARHRLLQLRQQLNPGELNPGTTHKNSGCGDRSVQVAAGQTVPEHERTEAEAVRHTVDHKDGLVGQEVAEPVPPYRVSQPGGGAQQQGLRRLRTMSEDDPSARREVYWQVEALNQYRSEWVAEADSWYETSVASV